MTISKPPSIIRICESSLIEVPSAGIGTGVGVGVAGRSILIIGRLFGKATKYMLRTHSRIIARAASKARAEKKSNLSWAIFSSRNGLGIPEVFHL
jgi:hypothetical protein